MERGKNIYMNKCISFPATSGDHQVERRTTTVIPDETTQPIAETIASRSNFSEAVNEVCEGQSVNEANPSGT
jgi:NaMN:DMB phosphoribosyltransferase